MNPQRVRAELFHIASIKVLVSAWLARIAADKRFRS